MLSDYLRRQAETCLRIARAGFDLATAERLGRLAAELREKADELDEQEREAFRPHLHRGNGSSRGNGLS